MRNFSIVFLTFVVQLSIFNHAFAEELKSCSEKWSFSGILPGMRYKEVKSQFPEAEKGEKWKYKASLIVFSEIPNPGINISSGKLTINFGKNNRVSSVRLESKEIFPTSSFLEKLEKNWGKGMRGISCGIILTLKGTKPEDIPKETSVHTVTTSWSDNCGYEITLYHDKAPYLWLTDG